MTELNKIRALIQKAKLPHLVKDLHFELDTDSIGDPAVRIMVIVDDQDATDEGFFNQSMDIRGKIARSLRSAGITRWPYVSFRTESEQRELATSSHR